MIKRLLSTLAGVSLAVAAVAPAAVAQDAASMRAVRFGVEGGLSMPTGDFGDAADMGFLIGGIMDIMPANWPVAIRTNLDYQRWGTEADIDFTTISVTGDVSRHLTFGAIIGGGRFERTISGRAPVKAAAAYKIVGHPVPRVEIPAKVSGKHVYVHDVRECAEQEAEARAEYESERRGEELHQRQLWIMHR